MKEIEILNPLNPGFYESLISNPDYGEYESDDHELGGFLSKYDITLEYDFKKYMNNVSSGINDLFIERVNEEVANQFGINNLLIEKEYEEIDSPREYNFSTDRAFVIVKVNKLKYKKFIDLMFEKYYDELKSMIEHKFTSYDGFISFYSNDIKEWETQKYDYDHNELETIFITLLDGENFDDDLCEIMYQVFSEEINKWYEWTKNGRTHKYSFWELQNLVEIKN
jgi:hypothetical protein